MRALFGAVYSFDAVHRLRSPYLDEAANLQTYGKCGRAPGHGHRYRVTVVVGGPWNHTTGRVVAKRTLDEAVAPVLAELRDAGLAVVGDRDMSGIATGEHIVAWIAKAISARLAPTRCSVERVELEETHNNRFHWRRKESACLSIK